VLGLILQVIVVLLIIMSAELKYCVRHPTTIIVAGPTQGGKTHFVLRLIKEQLIQPPPEVIYWVYRHFQHHVYEVLGEGAHYYAASGSEVKEVLERIFKGLNKEKRNLLVIDDQMQEASDSPQLSNIFTEGSHHLNLTVIYIVQNLFQKGKGQRTANINTHYSVIFRNPRDLSGFHYLARQLAPGKSRSLVEVFDEATKTPFSYLCVNCHPLSKRLEKYATRIFPGEETVFYEPV